MLKPYVASRAQKITQEFPAAVWKYVPIADHLADLLTMGISADSLALSRVWRHGPPWLIDHSQLPVWNFTEVLHLQVADTEDEQLEVDADSLGYTVSSTLLHTVVWTSCLELQDMCCTLFTI